MNLHIHNLGLQDLDVYDINLLKTFIRIVLRPQLEKALVTCFGDVFHELVWEDNTPIHILKVAYSFLISSNIELLLWLAQSPDITPIKNLWSYIEVKICQCNSQPSNIVQLEHNNIFKVAITPDTTTLKYYQLIYTHCKQRFNIQDRIEIFKKSLYQYIKNCINNYFFGNYNISEVRNNLYNNLVHYSQLGIEDLNSETLATYFQELNFNIIEYCKKKYPVQFKYFLDFESETETSNKGKQKVKQYSRTTSNTSILPKTTAKHLQTPEQRTSSPKSLTQQQEPILTSTNIIDYLQENKSNQSKNLESEETKLEQEETTKNEEEMATAYIAKISEFTGENNNTSPQKWLDKVQKAGDFIAELKDKLIKKVCPHILEDLATAIRHAKNYKMAMKEANYIKFVNLAIGKTSSAAEKKIDQLTKKVENYFTNQQQQQQPQRY
ncbi:hypothetical protein G9A89_017337 [Geosiphon pyriformis]|nr:hypothetical protein G9A89_017337 [Geosiphon pyriformis]